MRVLFACVLVSALAVAATAGAQDPAKVAAGEKVFAAQKCAVCHSVAGKGNAKGPLDGVGAKLTADEIRQWHVDPKAMTEKTKATRKPVMPSYTTKMSKGDLDAIVAYMQSLKKK